MNINSGYRNQYTAFKSQVIMTPDVLDLANRISEKDQESLHDGILKLESNGKSDVVLLSDYDATLPRMVSMTCFKNDNGTIMYTPPVKVNPGYRTIDEAYQKASSYRYEPLHNGMFDGYSILNCIG